MSAAALRHQGPNNRIWGLSAAAAAALHLAAAGAALVTLVGEPEDEDTGAPAIEISLAPAAPQVEEAPDAPPGPQSEEAAAAAPAVAASQTKDNDDPKIARTEAEDADYSLSEKHEKPVEEPTKHEATPVVSAESAASEAKAPPKSDVVQEAPHAVAPAPGVDKAARAAKLTWQKTLMAHLNRHKRYPTGVGRRSAEVTVSFTLDRLGHVVASNVKRSAGDRAFDEAALTMMKRADPVPPPPAATADEGLTFEVPVVFRADKR
ncbi:MAG TPA: TonB family protein [Methylosinus sp.]|jgi:TonB family protein